MRFLAWALCLKHGEVALLHPPLKVGLKVTLQIIGGFVFLVVLVNLFCSILNQRLLEHFQSVVVLHKSQSTY